MQFDEAEAVCGCRQKVASMEGEGPSVRPLGGAIIFTKHMAF